MKQTGTPHGGGKPGRYDATAVRPPGWREGASTACRVRGERGERALQGGPGGGGLWHEQAALPSTDDQKTGGGERGKSRQVSQVDKCLKYVSK